MSLEDLFDEFFGPSARLYEKDKQSATSVDKTKLNGLKDDISSFIESVDALLSSSDGESFNSTDESDSSKSVSSARSGGFSDGENQSINSRSSHCSNNSSLCSCSSKSTVCSDVSSSKKKRSKSSLKKSEFKKTKKASDLKRFVYETSLMEFSSLHCDPARCSEGGTCVQSTTIGEAIALRKSYWGSTDQIPFSPSERGKKTREILLSAFSRNEDKFIFKLGSRIVCERGFLTVLGILTQTAGRPAGSWTRAKTEVKTNPDDLAISRQNSKTVKSAKANRSKFQNATAYIEYVAAIYGDTLPVAGQENTRALPYEDIGQFFDEYVHHCERAHIYPTLRAEKTTFRNAFRAKKDIRLLGCKGSFETCDICNHANDLLRDTGHALTREQRDIVLRFKRLHLEQQGKERQYMEDNKQKCINDFDESGNPLHAMIYSDGMTVMRGETPKLGRTRKSKGDQSKKITNRVIGVEVYCGPVSEVFLYHTDDFVRSGASIMVEIQRQALIDLGALLNTEHDMALPRHIYFQFDNSGENKNKHMFAYFSMLIETGVLDKIDVNFMIVGHTHSSIDQYFSTLSGAIGDSGFIGSPMALWKLLSTAHSKKAEHKRPKIQRHIRVYYDMFSLDPYISQHIMYYQLPFNFKFSRVCGKAVMQYRLFSSFPTWLPKAPDGVMQTQADLFNSQVHEIALQRLAVVGGQDALLAGMNLNEVTTTKLLGSNRINSNFQTLTNTIPDLHSLEERAIENQQQRMQDEAMEYSFLEREQALKARYVAQQSRLTTIQKALTRNESDKCGYIIWLDSTRRTVSNLPPLEQFSPTPFSPALLVQHLLDAERRREVVAPPVAVDADGSREGVTAAAPVPKGVPAECKRMFRAAGVIREAAANVLDMIDSGRIKLANVYDEYNFKNEVLCGSEHEFYMDMATSELSVLQTLLFEYERAPQWHPLPETHMSAGYKTRCAQRKAEIVKNVEDMMAVAQKLLMKDGHNNQDNTEFVTRSRETKLAAQQAVAAANAATNAARKQKRLANEVQADSSQQQSSQQSSKKTKSTRAVQGSQPVSGLDSFCSCNECPEPVAERCSLCGYCVCNFHRNCSDFHSKQLKRSGASQQVGPSNYSGAVSASNAARPRGQQQPPLEIPLTQPRSMMHQPVGPAVQPVPALQDMAPLEIPLTQPRSGEQQPVGPAVQPVQALQHIAPLEPLTQVDGPVEQPVDRTVQPGQLAGVSRGIVGLQTFAGVWDEPSTEAAHKLAAKIVSTLVGESKKPKGVSYQTRLIAELDFAPYVRSGQLTLVAKYFELDVTSHLLEDGRVGKDWKGFVNHFVVLLLGKFEL